MPPNIYVYKCVVDDGTAPCVDRSLLSMTVCKPKVRTSAKVGDIVIAFGTNAQPAPNRLVYAAKITEVVTGGRYFDEAKYQTRKDCIYKRRPQGTLKLTAGASAHNTGTHAKDIGNPPTYPNAIALISTDFRYFGGAGTDEWKEHAPHLTKMVEQLGQGHRVNHSREVRDDLLKLIGRVWKQFPRKVNGKPRHATGVSEQATVK
jgi:Nucleotide modification associated domain 2